MTDYRIEKLPFDPEAVNSWGQVDRHGDNWPVVYTISNNSEIYIGETVNAATRLTQHLHSSSKKHLEHVQIVLNETFNKSVCLDLESHLIKYFAADEKHRVLNGNFGITDANYFDRESYRATFGELFDLLVSNGMLSRSIPEIINSNLFKFSPFKSLNSEQAIAISGILENLASDLQWVKPSQLVIQGDPGTGKTIVAIYLVKLIRDISLFDQSELLDSDSIFSDFFTPEYANTFRDLKIALVVPQQSLRATLRKVFRKTPGLVASMVMTPWEIAESSETFDLLIVDEAHRLGQRANQSSGVQNKKFPEINRKLFGADDLKITQLDWLKAKSKHQLLLLDTAQAVRPADLPISATEAIIHESKKSSKHFKLQSQMRVMGGEPYLEFIRAMFTAEMIPAVGFKDYDLRFFDDFKQMRDAIAEQEQRHGLSRLLAGFAWEWKSKLDPNAYDIEIDGIQMRWNTTAKDWIDSPTSSREVGSIHTIQGYDLNYAGVIIGNDIGYDPESAKVTFNRSSYFDVKGRENNKQLGIKYSDEEVLTWVLNIYRVLLTRGIRGTYVYVCDPALRSHLAGYFSAVKSL